MSTGGDDIILAKHMPVLLLAKDHKDLACVSFCMTHIVSCWHHLSRVERSLMQSELQLSLASSSSTHAFHCSSCKHELNKRDAASGSACHQARQSHGQDQTACRGCIRRHWQAQQLASRHALYVKDYKDSENDCCGRSCMPGC